MFAYDSRLAIANIPSSHLSSNNIGSISDKLDSLSPEIVIYRDRLCSEGSMHDLPRTINFESSLVKLILVTNENHDGFGFEATYQFILNPRMLSF